MLLKYPDSSEFCFETTLNPTILQQLGIILEEGKFVRLDKQYFEKGQMVYKQFSYREAKVSLYDQMTYTDERSARLRDFM